MEAPVLLGTLRRDATDAVVGPLLPRLAGCAPADLEGRVVLKVVVEESGEVSSVAVKATSIANPAVETCMMEVVSGVRFPKPDSGIVIVSYPFRFGPAGATEGG
jgi:TonB family protein